MRTFAPIMFRRLKKLGIDKTNPDDLTDEEKSRFARLDLDPEQVTWRRVTDTNDRYLREITVGQAATEKASPARPATTLPSPPNAWLFWRSAGISRTCVSVSGRMVVGTSRAGDPVTADDIGVVEPSQFS